MERKATDQRKYASHISDKEPVLYIYILNRKVTNNPTMKWAKDMNGCFAEGDIEMANEKSISKSHFTISITLQK